MCGCVCVWMCLHSAVGEPGGRGSGAGRGDQRGAERAPGPNQWLPVPGLAPPEPRPDESQRHQWDHEHRETLHQTPQGHLWGTKHMHTHTYILYTLPFPGMLYYQSKELNELKRVWEKKQSFWCYTRVSYEFLTLPHSHFYSRHIFFGWFQKQSKNKSFC